MLTAAERTRTNTRPAGSGEGHRAALRRKRAGAEQAVERGVLTQCDRCHVFGTGIVDARGRLTDEALAGSIDHLAADVEEVRGEWAAMLQDYRTTPAAEEAAHAGFLAAQARLKVALAFADRHAGCGGQLRAYDLRRPS